MLSAREAAAPTAKKRVITTQDLIESFSARIAAARAQGAKSVWIGPDDGYKPLGTDRRYQAPSDALVQAFETLIQNEYFLEFEMMMGVPTVRVGFRPAEIGNPVNLSSILRPEELSALYRLDTAIKF